MGPELIEIVLVPEGEARSGNPVSSSNASDEPQISSRSLHDRLARVRKPRVHVSYEAEAVVQHAVSIAIPAATALIGAWLQARLGRKVRVKIGDTEAEASTVAEVEQLLEKVRALRISDHNDQS